MMVKLWCRFLKLIGIDFVFLPDLLHLSILSLPFRNAGEYIDYPIQPRRLTGFPPGSSLRVEEAHGVSQLILVRLLRAPLLENRLPLGAFSTCILF
jgi:hypothetical protein